MPLHEFSHKCTIGALRAYCPMVTYARRHEVGNGGLGTLFLRKLAHNGLLQRWWTIFKTHDMGGFQVWLMVLPVHHNQLYRPLSRKCCEV